MSFDFPYIIADICSCWNRSDSPEKNLETALMQICAAASCGVSAVKFQMYTHLELYGAHPGGGYDNSYSLPYRWLQSLKEESLKSNVDFMCTAFSPGGLLEVNECVNAHKIASSDMKNVDLLDAAISTGKPTIISVGASHFLEIQWLINYWKDAHGGPLTILECVGAYPAPASAYHLGILHQLKGHVTYGISDHTRGDAISFAAIGCGATVFERHFDALKYIPSAKKVPDDMVTIGPNEMEDYCKGLKDAYAAMQNTYRRPTRAEDDFTLMHRRRIVALHDLRPGDTLKKDVNYGSYRVKSPDFRGAPMERVNDFDGKTVIHEIKAFHGIASADILWDRDANH